MRDVKAFPSCASIRVNEGEARPASWNGRPRALAGRTILLISADARFCDALRPLANSAGRMVVQVNPAAGALPILHAVNPVIVLLDLDLPKRAAWEAAEALLQDPTCPPLILLTASSGKFDAGSAVRAGSLVDKSAGPAHLLEMVEETLAMPHSTVAERNAIQRVLIRRLRASHWPLPFTPAYRFWGINE